MKVHRACPLSTSIRNRWNQSLAEWVERITKVTPAAASGTFSIAHS